jgi:serine acetyltransferase
VNSALQGSVQVGEDSEVITAVVMNQIKIGDRSKAGMGSVVIKDIESGVTVFGNPARAISKKEE